MDIFDGHFYNGQFQNGGLMNFRGPGESYTLGSALFALSQCFIFNQNVNWNLCFNIFYEVHYNPVEVH